jgi:diguanylate cyclase (GGDEF)-like protein
LQRFWKRLLHPEASGIPPGKTQLSSVDDVRLSNVLANTTDLISLYDRDLRLTHYAAKLKSVRGNALAAGASLWEIYPSLFQGKRRDEIRGVLSGGSPITVDLRQSQNEAPWSVLAFSAGDGIGIIELQGEHGGQPAAQVQEHLMLVHQAAHDMLTGLQNRRRFSERLQEALSELKGSKGKTALLQIDLDNFKSVNDTLGHGTGDVLLQLAADRIRNTLMEGDSAYRYAGDEFAVIQSGKDQPAGAERLAEALVNTFDAPFVINGMPLYVGASIGIAFGPEHGAESEELMKAADIALYAAKKDGRGCARAFNRSMLLLIEQRENLRRSLRMALERRELFLEYQPIFRPRSSLMGFEALLRWRHPEIGIIPPTVFVPIAEGDGLMDAIGYWVLEEACRQAMTWPSSLTIGVNLSPVQFLSGSLTDRVAQAMDAAGIQPDRLYLEITETVLLEKTVDNLDTLNTLNVLGVNISLDDFGTHYSSLSYLKNFPFDVIKIDKYFINDLETDRKSQAIVRSIIGLAHGLEISVTAEGVETAGQARWLTEQGCDCLQGNYLGRPVSPDEAYKFFGGSRTRSRVREKENRAL